MDLRCCAVTLCDAFFLFGFGDGAGGALCFRAALPRGIFYLNKSG